MWGAGTIEFIYDVDDAKYYFLEMNTRIQVEHPITELITGVDLVQEQLKVAAGHELSFTQSDVKPRGAAIECRIYAEDPDHNFAPSTGLIKHLVLPAGEGIRVDSGVVQGDTVSRHYDPMLMKLVVWNEDRKSAIEHMIQALEDMIVIGVATPIGFHLDVLQDSTFVSGEYTTDFVNGFAQREMSVSDSRLLAIAAALSHHINERALQDAMQMTNEKLGKCVAMESMTYAVVLEGQCIEVEIKSEAGQYFAIVGDEESPVELTCDPESGLDRLTLSGVQEALAIRSSVNGSEVYWRGKSIPSKVEPLHVNTLRKYVKASATGAADGIIKSHMPGLIVKIEVDVGQEIAEGDGLLIIEAMKMENEIRSPVAGVVESIEVSEGEEVAGGTTLCILSSEAANE